MVRRTYTLAGCDRSSSPDTARRMFSRCARGPTRRRAKDGQEGVAAFLEKRKANWTGR